MVEWNLGRPGRQCSACDREFEENAEFTAVLFERGEVFERGDFCDPCTGSAVQEGFSHWRTRLPPRETKKRLFVDDQTLVDLFVQLGQREAPLHQHFRFVLMLVLMRKRLVKFLQSVQKEDQSLWKVALQADKSEHMVADPRLSEDEVEAVSRQLGQILYGSEEDLDQLANQPTEAEAVVEESSG
jgi:hypothetical protein